MMKILLLAYCLVLFCGNANAILISQDWRLAGDRLITLDTVTGLEWLDATETWKLSLDNVVGQLGQNERFDGFRIATTPEVKELFANGGYDRNAFGTNVNVYGDEALFDAGYSIVNLLGNTDDRRSNVWQTYGWVADQGHDGNHYYDFIQVTDNYNGVLGNVASSTSFDFWHNYSSNESLWYLSTWLVKDALPITATPEPATLTLFGIGCAGMLVRRFRMGVEA